MAPSLTQGPSPDEALRRQLAERCSEHGPYPAHLFAGSGIVICAGGAAIFTNAYVLIHVLRRELGCRLPIEVWHFGASELSDRMRSLLRALDADPVDADSVIASTGVAIGDGWQLKSLALMWSRFEQVLLLDADQVPEIDPSSLMHWPEFAATGAVLWPDICSILPDNPIWNACDLEPRRIRAVESGQLLIDKARHWRALRIILFLNEHADAYYRMVYGDKDLFLLGLILAAEPYALVPHLPFSDQPWCLFQRDFEGNRLFQHRTGAKWRYGLQQDYVPSFRYLEACERALTDLRGLWNGTVFNPPPRSHRARQTEAHLAGLPPARVDLSAGGRLMLELLAHNEIGLGRTSHLRNWFCTDDPLELVLCGVGEPLRLRSVSPGRWIADPVGQALPTVLYEGPGGDDGGREVPQVLDLLLRASGYPSPLWRSQIDALRAAFGLLLVIEPATRLALAAEAERIATLDPASANTLRALADDLPAKPPIPRIARPKWEPGQRYAFDDEHA